MCKMFVQTVGTGKIKEDLAPCGLYDHILTWFAWLMSFSPSGK